MIDAQTETKIVALIARGDTYNSIQSQLLDSGVKLSINGISKVKARNEESLAYIKGKMNDIEVSKAAQILSKARNLIDKKLDASMNASVPEHIEQAYQDGDIDFAEYNKEVKSAADRASVSIKDLTTISKEMFNQSQIEAGKPTSITETPEQAKNNLKQLLQAINSGNEEDIAKAIFLDA